MKYEHIYGKLGGFVSFYGFIVFISVCDLPRNITTIKHILNLLGYTTTFTNKSWCLFFLMASVSISGITVICVKLVSLIPLIESIIDTKGVNAVEHYNSLYY